MAETAALMNGYTVTPVDKDTWRITDIFQDYMYLVQGKERAALIDTGMGQPGLSRVVSALTDRPVIVLNTHGHLDHVGCNQEFDAIYMHPSDREVLGQHRSPAYREKIRSLAGDAGLVLTAPSGLPDDRAGRQKTGSDPYTGAYRGQRLFSG